MSSDEPAHSWTETWMNEGVRMHRGHRCGRKVRAPIPPIPVARLLILALLFLSGSVSIGRSALHAAHAAEAGQDGAVVNIGILAKRGVERCLSRWSATMDYLNERIPGHRFVAKPLGFDEIYPSVENQEVDFVMANSSFFVGLEKDYDASPIATLKNLRLDEALTVFAGAIFTRAGCDDISEIADLRGRSFMAVDRTSFGGWQMAWQELLNNGIDPFCDMKEVRFAGTDDAVVYSVLSGETDIGTVRSDTIERMASEGLIRQDELKLISPHNHLTGLPFWHSTQHYPEWPLAKFPHTDAALAVEVAVALMAMSRSDQAAIDAQCSGWTNPLSYQDVHTCLQELGIGPYEGWNEITLIEAARQHWRPLLIALGFLVTVISGGIVTLRLNRRLHGLVKELTRAEQSLDMALGAGRLGTWTWDIPGGEFIVCERWIRLLGYEPDEVEQTITCWQELLPEDAPFMEHLLASDMSSARTTSFSRQTESEHRMKAKNGEIRWILTRGRITEWTTDRHPTRAAGTFLDITERRQLATQLLQSQKLEGIGQLAAGIAHEINTPTQFIGDNLGFLEESVGDLLAMLDKLVELANRIAGQPGQEMSAQALQAFIEEADLDFIREEVPGAIAQSREGTDRVAKIVRAMKDFSHPGSNDKELCRINDAVNSTVTVTRNEWKYDAEIELDLDADIPLVPCLIGQIKQVILNLLVNAAQAIGQKRREGDPLGKITIATRQVEDAVELRVTDTGCGIPSAAQPRIFEQFFTTKEVGRGTGQGLALAHRTITTGHGGTITFETTPGCGSTFIVRLPIVAAGAGAAEGRPAA